jgi:hypothetical protein
MKVMVCMSMIITLISVLKWLTIMKSGIFCGIATFAISMAYCGQNSLDAKKTKDDFHLVHQTTQPNLGLCTLFF